MKPGGIPQDKLAEGLRFRSTFTSRSALANKLLEAKISSALVEHISVAMAPSGAPAVARPCM